MRIHYRSFVQVNEYNILSRRTNVFLKLRTGLLVIEWFLIISMPTALALITFCIPFSVHIKILLLRSRSWSLTKPGSECLSPAQERRDNIFKVFFTFSIAQCNLLPSKSGKVIKRCSLVWFLYLPITFSWVLYLRWRLAHIFYSRRRRIPTKVCIFYPKNLKFKICMAKKIPIFLWIPEIIPQWFCISKFYVIYLLES